MQIKNLVTGLHIKDGVVRSFGKRYFTILHAGIRKPSCSRTTGKPDNVILFRGLSILYAPVGKAKKNIIYLHNRTMLNFLGLSYKNLTKISLNSIPTNTIQTRNVPIFASYSEHSYDEDILKRNTTYNFSPKNTPHWLVMEGPICSCNQDKDIATYPIDSDQLECQRYFPTECLQKDSVYKVYGFVTHWDIENKQNNIPVYLLSPRSDIISRAETRIKLSETDMNKLQKNQWFVKFTGEKWLVRSDMLQGYKIHPNSAQYFNQGLVKTIIDHLSNA